MNQNIISFNQNNNKKGLLYFTNFNRLRGIQNWE